MTGHPRIIGYLQRAVSHEFGAAQQFTLQAGLAESWALVELAQCLRRDAAEELAHAEAFIQQLIRLGVTPSLAQPRLLPVGGDHRRLLQFGLETELDAIRLYSEASRFCARIGDTENRSLFARILEDEEQHARGIRQALDNLH